MAYQPLQESLAKPSVVAYLSANAERLGREGVFKGQPTAFMVFTYWCHHPDANSVPPPDKRSGWTCPVDGPHHEPAVIVQSVPADLRSVRRSIDWMEEQGLVDVDRGDRKGKYKKYGPVTIRSTNARSDWRHRIARPFANMDRSQFAAFAKQHDAASHPVPPVESHDAAISGTVPLLDDTPVPTRPTRTVSATRLTWANGRNLEASGILKIAPPARMGAGRPGPSDAPDADAPDTRPVGTSEGRSHIKAGHTAIPDDTIEDSSLLHDPLPGDGLGLLPGNPSGGATDAVDAEVELVMARLYESGLWGHQETHTVVA